MLVDDVKKNIRIKTDALNDEVNDIIDSAKADLILSGVLKSKVETLDTDKQDALIKRCILLYAKAHFGLDNEDSEKYQESYNSLKIHLTLSQEYTVEAVV